VKIFFFAKARENEKNGARLSDEKASNLISAGALPQTLLEELTVLSQTP